MNIKISQWQKDFINRKDDDMLIAVCGIGSGKTFILSTWLVLVNLLETRKTLAIAQTYKALDRVLFQSIMERCNEWGVNATLNRSSMQIMFDNGSIIYGYSAENAVAMLGLTCIDTLAIDEAAYVDETVYNYAKDRMRGSSNKSLVRLISSPNNTRVSNWFSTLATTNISKVIHASTLDNPFIADSFKNELRERYVEGSKLWRQQVLGEIFETEANDLLLHVSDISIGMNNIDSNLINYAGYDASGLGNDTDVLTIVNNKGIIKQFTLPDNYDTISKANYIKNAMEQYNVVSLFIDNTGGYGQGVLDILNTYNKNAIGINFSSIDDAEYPNVRTQMYVELSKCIKSGFIVNNDEHLINQLKNIIVTINNKGKLQLAPKDMMKKLIGCSPDKSDSLALAIHAMMKGNNEQTKTNAKDIAMRYLAALKG